MVAGGLFTDVLESFQVSLFCPLCSFPVESLGNVFRATQLLSLHLKNLLTPFVYGRLERRVLLFGLVLHSQLH